MKRFLLILILLGLVYLPSFADVVDTWWSPFGIGFVIPLKYDSLVSLYDTNHGGGMVGAETQIVQVWNIKGNIGGVTTSLFAGSPYASANYDFGKLKLTPLEITLSKFGIFIGINFDTVDSNKIQWLVGLKTSTEFKLW